MDAETCIYAEKHFITTAVLRSLGALVSIVCVTLVLRAWCLMPQWRTLQNYINMNQILWGAVEISWWCVIQIVSFITCLHNTEESYENILCIHFPYYKLCIQMYKSINPSIATNHFEGCTERCVRDMRRMPKTKVCYFLYPFLDKNILENIWYVLLTSGVCWSFIAIMLAFFRLVLVKNKKISYEKRIVTIFALTMTATVSLFINVSWTYFIHRSNTKLLYNQIGDHVFYSLIASNYWTVIIIVSLALFIKIVVSVMSCCKTSMSRRRYNQIVSLVGVAVLGDTFIMLFVVIKHYQHFNDFGAAADNAAVYDGSVYIFDSYEVIVEYFANSNRTLDVVIDCIHMFRLVPLTVALLLNRSSREHWNRYRQRRERLLLARLKD